MGCSFRYYIVITLQVGNQVLVSTGACVQSVGITTLIPDLYSLISWQPHKYLNIFKPGITRFWSYCNITK